jgi:tetratricopeptide (TPR) repeat protein
MDYLSLCLICKDENDYLPEWLDYHILMGVDRFYIYDNESRVSLRESLRDYIQRGWVVVVDIPGSAMQLFAYDHCLQTFGHLTFWLGFIDTDEFLVPHTTLDLKEFLREYEPYAGLAVSSLFFGSNGHKLRPTIGQLAAYTTRPHATFRENELVKSIVQPSRVLMPNSPHDVLYREDAWGVNETGFRVDYQRFPNHTEKIQVNHYYCRSEKEIDQKLKRGNSGAVTWPRRLFEAVNRLSTDLDESVLVNLETLFQRADQPVTLQTLLPAMAALAGTRLATPPAPEMLHPLPATSFRPAFSEIELLKAQTRAAMDRHDINEAQRLVLQLLQRCPQNINLYDVLATIKINLGDAPAAWQLLTQAWQLSPGNNYIVLLAMAHYFLRIANYPMVENTCHLVLALAPHDMNALGLLAWSLLEQGRPAEALSIGVPLVELCAQLGELPERVGLGIVKKLADYLRDQKDYTASIHLWQLAEKCQPTELAVLIELVQVQLLQGDQAAARQVLQRAAALAPGHPLILDLQQQASSRIINGASSRIINGASSRITNGASSRITNGASSRISNVSSSNVPPSKRKR